MLSYPQLQLPQSWKPLFRALAENGWELSGNLPEIPDWTTRNILIFQNRNQPWLGDRFLTFLEEPIWCGNVLQPHGFSIAAVCQEAPQSQSDAEKACLPLSGDWKNQLVDFIAEIDKLNFQE